MIKMVQTERFLSELETRGSHPSKFYCSDGETYIVKHFQQKNNYKHLINEFIASQLGKLINLSIPEFSLVEIKKDIVPREFNFSRGRPEGLGFGSKFIPGPIKYISDINELLRIIEYGSMKIIDDLLAIILFDIWLRNCDRSINNPNLLVQEIDEKLNIVAIDHASIFSELNYLNLETEMNEIPSIGENLVDNELFRVIFNKKGLFFDKYINDICTRISNLEEQKIIDVIAEVPPQWNLDKLSQVKIKEFIINRKNSVESHFMAQLKDIGF